MFHFLRPGFSALVEQVLGQPLDKREQVSDWAQRPLSQSQLYYAALDAYAVLQVTFILNYTTPKICYKQVTRFRVKWYFGSKTLSFVLTNVVYFDHQTGAPHAIHWSESFVSALKKIYHLFPSLRKNLF